MTRAAVLSTLALLGALLASTASAQAVRVGTIRGPGGRAAARELGGALETAGVRVTDDAEALVEGRLARRGRRLTLRLTLTAGGAEESLRFTDRNSGRLLREAAEGIAAQLGGAPPATEAATPAGPAAPPRESAAEPSAPESSSRGASPAAGPAPPDVARGREIALELSVGFGWMMRGFAYSDDPFGRGGSYFLPAAPVIYLSGRWMPLLHWTNEGFAGVGVETSFAGAPGVSTVDQSARPSDEPRRSGATIDDFQLGLFYRLRPVDELAIEAGFGYGEARFRGVGEGPRTPDSPPAYTLAPPVHYRYVRPRLALEVMLPEGLSVRAGAAWRGVLDAGRLGDAPFLSRSFTTGFDVGLDVTWRFHPWMAARVHATYTRYVTDHDAQVGDPLVVGGAVDDWARAVVEFVATIPGAP